MTNISIKQSIWIIALIILSACGNDIAKVGDSDLRQKVQECDYAMNMSAAEHQVCANYHRECKRRLESEGRFVCN
jgi:hypothetical protein